MNYPQSTDTLLPIREFAKTRFSRRGFPVHVSHIYRLISQHKKGLRELDFKYIEIGKAIWIVKES